MPLTVLSTAAGPGVRPTGTHDKRFLCDLKVICDPAYQTFDEDLSAIERWGKHSLKPISAVPAFASPEISTFAAEIKLNCEKACQQSMGSKGSSRLGLTPLGPSFEKLSTLP
jgi:hypothetical protein